MTCAHVPAQVWPEKYPGATLDYAVDFERVCAREWSPWTDFATSTRIRVFSPGQGSGYEFEATTGGRTAGRNPTFGTSGTTRDGSVVWTPRAITAASLLRTISGTPAWTADAGVTVSAVAVAGFKAIAKIAGGTDGEDYGVKVTATGSDGLVIVELAILPVRVPVRVCS